MPRIATLAMMTIWPPVKPCASCAADRAKRKLALRSGMGDAEAGRKQSARTVRRSEGRRVIASMLLTFCR